MTLSTNIGRIEKLTEAARISSLIEEGVISYDQAFKFRNEHDPFVDVDYSLQEFVAWRYVFPKLQTNEICHFDVRNIEKISRRKFNEMFNLHQEVSLHEIFEKVKKDEIFLRNSPGIFELIAIRKRGEIFYQKYFDGHVIPGWRGAIEIEGGAIKIPTIGLRKNKVFLNWLIVADGISLPSNYFESFLFNI